MKKYLLGLLAIPFSLIAFSSAVDINLTCEGQGDCSPSPFYTFEDSYNNLCFNFNTHVYGEIYNDDYSLSLPLAGETFVCGDIPAGTVNFYHGVNSSETYVISFNLPGDDNTGGDSGESGELIGQLTPVIDGLESAMSEFIPYVVYVGLGVLGVIIGFVAIKWLMNYVKGKSLSTFNSRRKK